jgi:Uma2 family endonuclease
MATTAISVQEYLDTMYHPDRDYVDGVAVERNLGEQEHALFQAFLAAWFFNHRKEWGVVSLTEQRVQVQPDRFRVPDVCLRSASDPLDPILWRPPVLCVEIMSPKDRLNLVRTRLQDYVEMGVRDIWVIDPICRRAYACVYRNFAEVPGVELRIAGTDIHVPLPLLWAELEQ